MSTFRPNFQISNNLLQYIASIEASREVIKNAPIVPAWEAKFQEEAMVRTVYHGTRLEGNELSQEQAERVLSIPGTDPEKVASGAGIVGKARDIQEIINYRSVLDWINSWGESLQEGERPKYTEDMLKTLHSISVHRIIAPDQCGTYRDHKVIVRGVESGQVVHRPPEPEAVPGLVKEFLEWLNSDAARRQHVVFRAAVTHYQLVNIHPFIEGNGRTARAMALALMYAEDFDVKRFFSLEQYFDNDIENYYLAIRSVQNSKDNDMTYWLEYFSYGLAIELDRIKQQVLKLSQDFRLHQKLGHQVALSERQLIVMEYLQEQGKATSSDLNEILPMISTDTILRDLKDLIDKGLVKKHGVTKGVHYTLE
ncbi:Fic family protein [Candidatus Woesebacteria bacterium]|nr:Fic family protein [Candidatus Woesebacteria bacterium]MCD8527278.1 Fic family protein [Candidatus Woesebacteria bacterium]